MPYIDQLRREMLANIAHSPETIGELNYTITKLLTNYATKNYHHFGYTQMNELVGVLECAKLEFYRRVAAPYEDKKITENGDVY
jgi:hypothetical protein